MEGVDSDQSQITWTGIQMGLSYAKEVVLKRQKISTMHKC